MTISRMIGDLLKEKIQEKGINYVQFAEEAEVTHGYISKVINGNIKSIGIDTLEKLVRPLNMSVTEFLQEVEKKKTQLTSLLPVMN